MANKLKTLWKSLGPGLITGASDDDPAGITIYALAGAQFGFTMLWITIATLPFMIIIQRMAGRIGLVSGRGLAGNMKRHYPAWLLLVLTLFISVANIINIGADISAMAAALNILIPFPPMILSGLISIIIIVLLILLPYRTIAHYLKWIAIVLFSYVLSVFFIDVPWQKAILHSLVPHISLDRSHIAMLVALFGTTISPYLFFWQASEVVEEERIRFGEKITAVIPDVAPRQEPKRSNHIIKNEIGTMYKDVYFGMIFSNIITFFIIVMSATTLFNNGFTQVGTLEDIAKTLEPLAGHYANVLFMIGIIASGILAIPVLAGSAAYALAEVFGWKDGFDRNFRKAKQFYLVIILATLLGLAIPALGLHPVNILYYTGIIFGFIAPFLILMVIHMANNPKIMGKFTSRPGSNIIAYALFIIMTISIMMLFV
ncbi:Nramp family divalent metal transporter [Candidatus Parcubacteria bacterium]|nr:Nramp family divalent metal transporter [Candidatus Parcubacteria bacterium]